MTNLTLVIFLILCMCNYHTLAFATKSLSTFKTTATTSLKSTPIIPTITTSSTDERRSLLTNLLHLARTHGQIGAESSFASQKEIISVASKLRSYSLPDPSSFPLQGVHSLVYSLSESIGKDGTKKGGASAGKIGPFVGKVTQEFVTEKEFRNVVQLAGGLLKVALSAEREIVDKERIKVTFRTTTFYVGGLKVLEKETKGSGIWKVLFVGEFEEEDGKKMLVRVMETPKLFVITQDL